MEEEIQYATVVFKNGQPLPKENKEEATIYAEVKTKAPAVPDGEAAAAQSHFRVMAVCLGIICALLAASIGTIVYVIVEKNQHKANLSLMTAENKQLMTEKTILERKIQELNRVKDNLTWTMGVILKFENFPVGEFCPENKCQPCRTGWILFREKCYLFYNEDYPWLTWENSRKYCQRITADLVVVENLQEQEFISSHSQYYYDYQHGYWMGLYKNNDQNWVWIDGRNDTLGYWIPMGELGDDGSYALMIPRRDPTVSWDPAGYMYNRFICETDVLIKSNE